MHNSLSAKVFFLVFSSLTVCSMLIYGIVIIVLPKRYQFTYDSRLEDNADALFAELEGQSYDEAVKQIYNFCIQNRSACVLSNGQTSVCFGEIESDTLTTATTTILGVVHLAELTEGCTLVISSISKTTTEISALLLKLVPAVFFIILLLSALSAFICSKIIVSPIAEISRISRRMTALDMTWRCDVKNTDEIGVLASSLNTMADRLHTVMGELESANHRLEQDVEHFQRLEEERRHFFTAVSHELKTPLTILRGQIENMMLGYGDFQNHEKYLPETLKTIEDIEILVREILSVTKMENMDIDDALQEISLSDTVNYAVKTLLPLAENKDILIHCTIVPDRLLAVNSALWSKALSNIIGNAVRHSPGGAEVFVFLRAGNVLVVENTGVTIPEGDLPHLFTPFYRADKSRSKATGGSGLGLFIVKTILDLHGMTCRICNAQHSVVFEIDLKKA
ncbi:MAG: HAMP domain-containing protein [Lachnospiraceae bacterium]|nr:HAMP domain-containing protein [Lachnospiraceae bacterium]